MTHIFTVADVFAQIIANFWPVFAVGVLALAWADWSDQRDTE